MGDPSRHEIDPDDLLRQLLLALVALAIGWSLHGLLCSVI
jgi:hypothetical protein